MRSHFSVLLLMAAMLVVAGSTLKSSPRASTSASDDVRVIEVNAKKYEFSPSPIRVKQGTKVQLKITATDHSHGFKIKEYPEGQAQGGSPGLVFSSSQDCQKIEKNQTQTIEFLAQTPGTYPFKCCVHCGWNHRSMKGELIVEP